MRPNTLALACLAVTAAPAFGQVTPSAGLRTLDSVQIRETDTLFLSRPAQIVLGAGGHVFLTDAREPRVIDIGPGGRIERVFGRKGSGPGEFEAPTAMAISGDTLLAVYDHRTKRVTYINIPRWILARVSPVVTQRPPVIKFVDGHLFATHWDFGTNTSLARIVEKDGTLDEKQGVIPDLGDQTQMLIGGAFWNAVFAPVSDQIFAMYEASNSLFVWERGSRTAREITLPAKHRRGLPAGLFESLLRDPARATPAMIYDRSVPVALAPITPDIVALVTRDVKVESDKWYTVHYVTLYDHRRNTACPDLEVPASRLKVALLRDPFPIVALRGDTLALLEQSETADAEPIQLLRRYRIEPDRCQWSAVSR